MKKELTQVKHARSAKEYPEIDLEKDEYVVLHIKRSRVGGALIWVGVLAMLIALTTAIILIANSPASLEYTLLDMNEQALGYLRLAIFALYAIIIASGFIAKSIYDQNQLYITNHRAIQKTRTSIFANSTNIIKLNRIEDVSYRQSNLLETIFQIGTLRMSTVGDETTYTFSWLDTPRDEVKTISHLIYDSKHVHSAKEDKKED